MRTKARYSVMRILVLLTLLSVVGCGGNSLGTAVGNPPSGGSKVAGAIAALFSTETSSNLSALKIIVKQQQSDPVCEGTPAECMCAEVAAGEVGPQDITSETFGEPGTYGSATLNVTVGEEDFCTLPDGTTENPDEGVDGLGRFATFELIGDVAADCTDGAVSQNFAMKAGSAGIYRNTDASGSTPAYFPQIFGSFEFEFDGELFAMDCAIFLAEDGSVLEADCTDEEGNAITQEDGLECRFEDE